MGDFVILYCVMMIHVDLKMIMQVDLCLFLYQLCIKDEKMVNMFT